MTRETSQGITTALKTGGQKALKLSLSPSLSPPLSVLLARVCMQRGEEAKYLWQNNFGTVNSENCGNQESFMAAKNSSAASERAAYKEEAEKR